MHMGIVLAELSGGRKPNRVLCTGHSLGGALATLGAPFRIQSPDLGHPTTGGQLGMSGRLEPLPRPPPSFSLGYTLPECLLAVDGVLRLFCCLTFASVVLLSFPLLTNPHGSDNPLSPTQTVTEEVQSCLLP